MPIYGDMLAFFPEQFRRFDYFQMIPQTKASYDKRNNLGKVSGVFQYMKSGDLRKESDTVADILIPTLWTRTKLLLVNSFIQKEDEVYRIMKVADWLYEGGFNCYVLELVTGGTDQQQEFSYVDIGQNSYD